MEHPTHAEIAAATAEIRETPQFKRRNDGRPPSARAREGDGGPEGLSYGHISPQREEREEKGVHGFMARVAVGGRLFKLKGVGRTVDPHEDDASRRGKCKAFSRKARQRFMQSINELPRDYWENAALLTLTYPGDWPQEPEKWKRDLDAFKKALMRRDPQAFGYWKLEAQKRGAPHYHFVVFHVHAGPAMREWVAETWYRIVGSGDRKHLLAGTQVDPVRKARSLGAYISKYMSKWEESSLPHCWHGAGRWWGVLNQDRLNGAKNIVTVAITHRAFVKTKRVMRKRLEKLRGRKCCHLRPRGRSFSGVSLYINDHSAFRLLNWAKRAVGDLPDASLAPERPPAYVDSSGSPLLRALAAVVPDAVAPG